MNIAHFIINPVLRSPQHKDYRLANILAWLLLVFFVFIIPYTIYYWIANPDDTSKISNNVLGLLILICATLLFRYTDNIKRTLIVLSLMSYVPVMISIYYTGGIYSSDMIWIVLLILMQTVFVGYKWASICGIISCTYIIVLSVLENKLPADQNHFKAYIISHSSTHITINLLFVIVLLVVLLTVFARILESANLKLEKLSAEKIADLENALNQKTVEFSKIRRSLAKDFYDDMGSNLASINILTQSITMKLQDADEDIIRQLRNIESRSLELFEGTKDFIWGIDLKSDYVNEIYIYVRDFANSLLRPLQIQFYSELHHQGNANGRLNPTEGRQLVFICKELIVNAARHAACKEIFFHVAEQNNQLFIVISDNGKGYDAANVNKRGLKNVEDGLAKLQARQILNSSEQGTSVTLILNLQTNPFAVVEDEGFLV